MEHKFSTVTLKRGGGQGGGRPGEKGAGGVREAEEKGAGSRIPKVAGSGRKRENYATLCNISQSKKCKEEGANKYRAGTGIKGYGKRKV